MSSDEVISMKCVLIGDGAVGKSCLVIALETDSFPDDYVPTVHDPILLKLRWENKSVEFAIHDTAGQQDYDKLRPLEYPRTDVFLIACSLVDPISLENVRDKWVPEIRDFCSANSTLASGSSPESRDDSGSSCRKNEIEIPFVLVGTKLDLREDSQIMGEIQERREKPVTRQMGERMARLLGAACYVECSSKTQRGVRDVVLEAMTAVLVEKEAPSKNRLMKKCHVQ